MRHFLSQFPFPPNSIPYLLEGIVTFLSWPHPFAQTENAGKVSVAIMWANLWVSSSSCVFGCVFTARCSENAASSLLSPPWQGQGAPSPGMSVPLDWQGRQSVFPGISETEGGDKALWPCRAISWWRRNSLDNEETYIYVHMCLYRHIHMYIISTKYYILINKYAFKKYF